MPAPVAGIHDFLRSKTWMAATGAAMTTLKYRCKRNCRRSRIELGIPIEIVEPALMQIVGREQPAVPMQLVHRGLERHLRRPHLGLRHGQVALAQIARR